MRANRQCEIDDNHFQVEITIVEYLNELYDNNIRIQ